MLSLLNTKQISVIYSIIQIYKNNNHKLYTKLTVSIKIIKNIKKMRDIMIIKKKSINKICKHQQI